MILQEKARTAKRKAVADRRSMHEVNEIGKMTAEQKDIDSAFYRSQKGAMATSFGMQGVLNSCDYGYTAKNRAGGSRQQRLRSANANSRADAMSQRSGKSARSAARAAGDAVSYYSRVSGTSQGRRRLAEMIAQNSNNVPMKQ